MVGKCLKPVPGLKVVQVRSNITGRILNQRLVPDAVSSVDRIATNLMKGLIQDKRDVYITVLDSNLAECENFTL